MSTQYEAVIGLEVHCQVLTASKMFCTCPNEFGAEPNTNVCPVCMGHPGVMPVPNKEAIRKAVAAGLMCGCRIPNKSKFDRKSYFYPDMPKNYQLTQYDMPFCLQGKIHISGKGFSGNELPDKYIGLTRIHLEEDVAKSTHFGTSTGVDFNRAGVPLLEIVSEPDMRSADEAYAYLTALKQIMQYGGIGNCDMEKGQMRCDVNISIRPVGETAFGTKVELKNLNSFSAVHRAIAYEIKRQIIMKESGERIVQETRGWNDDTRESYLMRTKENADDYRYFPEPDLLPVHFTDEEIEAIRKSLPELPEDRRNRFVNDYSLTPYDAHVLTLEQDISEYFDAAAKSSKAPKLVANWIISELLRLLSEAKITVGECKIKPEMLGEMVNMIDSGAINGKIAKEVFADMFENGKTAAEIVKEKGLVQVSDESAILGFVQQAIAANPDQVQQFKDGKTAVLQFFVGQVMKASRGKANPKSVIKLLQEELSR
ncbi:MAG: Asp-tRNA(Asn)/Glu-tRNA(Gln) amidotransferase subunit GatB [Lentisphaeria bacterium]|nr:Asp-tRNA(Asn)/Glu-tRNA(Gln) amidotransferase subunit GatB [Lentisphaeria bacterium]